MTAEEKLAAYERMQAYIQARMEDTAARLARLKADGKQKTATYRQLLGDKLQYQAMLELYRIHGL